MEPNPPQPNYPQPPMPPQGGPQPMPGGPYPPPPGPMPPMGPVPYYPPQKKGFPVWAIVLIVLALFIPVVGCLALAAIPLITVNSSEARRAEGEQLLEMSRNLARRGYARLATAPVDFTSPIESGGCGVAPETLTGKFFQVRDRIQSVTPERATIVADPIQNLTDGTGHLSFDWFGGDRELTWK